LRARIHQADLQCAGPAGDDKTCRADPPAACAIAFARQAGAGDGHPCADFNGQARHAKAHWHDPCRERLGQSEQCDIGARAVTIEGFDLKLRMHGNARDVDQARRARLIINDLVGAAAMHAMRGGEHQALRQGRARTDRAVRADDHDDRAANALRMRRRAADDRTGRHGEREQAHQGQKAGQSSGGVGAAGVQRGQ